jgi:hypothetical protein
MIDVSALIELHRVTVHRWHQQAEPDNPYHGFLKLVCSQHQCNYLLWHEEDIARDPAAGAEQIAQVKRNIDRLNQARNDHIEQLDDALLRKLEAAKVQPRPDTPLATETPGSAIDRLSILALRIFHMEEQAGRGDADEGHRRAAGQKLAILHEQHRDLSRSLGELVADVASGVKRLKVYRQFKMYNDPALNPRIYNSPRRAAG